MTIKTRMEEHYDKKFDQFNEQMRHLKDTILLDETACDELLLLLNEKLPGNLNTIAHHLRQVLCLSIDVMKYEDALVNLKELKNDHRRTS